MSFNRRLSYQEDELHSFRKYLRWICVDYSSVWQAIRTWTMFIVFTLVVPVISHFFLACPDCDTHYSKLYDLVVQLSLSSLATVFFLSLNRFFCKIGIRRFLFFDKLLHWSDTVCENYKLQLNSLLNIVSYFVTPCFLAMSAYKIWWYASGGYQIPFLENVVLSDTVACVMELCSWLYRTTVIFLVCVLFRLICRLQILRLDDFFQIDSDADHILSEHRRIKRHLGIISRRYSFFILCLLIAVTGSLFASLLINTKTNDEVNIYRAGELAISSLTLVTALLIVLRSISKITHKAQDLTSLAVKWHAWATVDTFDQTVDGHTPFLSARTNSNNNHHDNNNNESQHATTLTESDHQESSDKEDDLENNDININESQHAIPLKELNHEESGDEEDDLENDNNIRPYASTTMSFQNRQALVSYFENNIVGITVYGFTMDRGTLYAIFGLQLSLTLLILGISPTLI